MSAEEQSAYVQRLVEQMGQEDDSDHEAILHSEDEWIDEDVSSDAENEIIPPEVNDSDTDDSDNDDNVQVMMPEHTENVTGESSAEHFVARDGTKWCKEAPAHTRVRSHNIVREIGGPTKETASQSLLQTFKKNFTEEMCDIIIRESNRKAHRTYAKWNEEHSTCIPKAWKLITTLEFDAYLGILITCGVHHSNSENTLDLWKPRSYPLYRAGMSLNRFWNISRFIRFDNELSRASRMLTDKAAPIRDIWEMLNENLRGNYKPHDCITIDEQLFPYRGRTKFTQYIPSKPAKYGIKVWWACDSKTSYPLAGQIYTGKINNQRDVNQGERVVKDLCQRYKNSGRTIIVDNFFTSLPLARLLISWNLGLVGTLKKNKPYIPKEMQAIPSRTPLSSEFGFSEQTTICSYVPKKRKSVILLSTVHYDKCVSGVLQKPDIISFYNKWKGGVDNMDKMLGQYTTKRRTLRWSLAFFYNILDVAALAAFIIYDTHNFSQKTNKRRTFLQDLGEALTMPAVEFRATNSHIMRNFGIRSAIECMMGHPIAVASTSTTSEPATRDQSGRLKVKGNCVICKEEGRRRPTRKCCTTCTKPVCAEHSTEFPKCNKCLS